MLQEDNVESKVKSVWKKEIKEKIRKTIVNEAKKKSKNMTKLRYIQIDNEYKIKNYFKQELKAVSKIMRMKLHMMDIAENYGEQRVCMICKIEEETLEHLFMCKKIPKRLSQEVNIDMIKSDDTEILKKVSEYLYNVLEYRNSSLI